MNTMFKRCSLATAIAGLCLSATLSHASSHREAPFITNIPKVDGADFYMFRSYETGREDFVTLIANYLPLQDPFAGPNYYDLDENAIYKIHIDNSGNAREDITFQFKFTDITQDLQLDIGEGDDARQVSVPLKNIGGIGPEATATENLQVRQEYELTVIRGDRRTGTRETATNVTVGTDTFRKPVDNIGDKSFSDYAEYANNHIYEVGIPGCNDNGQVFVGQRKEAFAVNLGAIFDLVNTNPLGERGAEGPGDLAEKNITSLALEVPTSCLTGTAVNSNDEPVIGAWTTSSVRQAQVINPNPMANGKGASIVGGAFTQVSRLGMPLVNEVVIGLKDKDGFNASQPMDDGQFIDYVTHPTLPALLEILFGDAGAAAPAVPRTDLVTAFLTGVPEVNMPVGVTASEMLRLNPSIPATPAATQNDLGVLEGDNAGFPNGRRPVDDVVDIALRVVMGALTDDAPNRDTPFTDGVQLDASELLEVFPYLAPPIGGAESS